MSKFKPGDIVFWMDGSTLCQSIVCVEDGKWPIVHEGFCIIYTISPKCGSREFRQSIDSSLCCDYVKASDLYPSADALIESIKDNLRSEYVKKITVLDAYAKGSNQRKQSLAEKVEKILLGRNPDE